MSEKINHWCIVCGRGYHACDACENTKNYTPWRSLTDSAEHFKIFTILRDYSDKRISRDEARKLLSGMDLSHSDTFKDSAKKVLDEILKETPARRRSPRKKKETDDLS